MIKTYPLPIYLQRFFIDRLATQLKASPNTIASYRDTFRLLLTFAERELGHRPTDLQIAQVDAELIGRFLVSIEKERGNGARSRNARLAGIRSFFKYVAINEPQLLHHCQRVLAMPSKRHERRTIDFLGDSEIQALVNAPDLSSWFGRRDRAILMLMLQTGLRVSELTHLHIGDVMLGVGANVRCIGKGRKERSTPLRKDSVKALCAWTAERGGEASDPLFIGIRGNRLSRDAVERLVRKHAQTAGKQCKTMGGKRVSPHVLRHSAAMQLLQNGADRTILALWLGHESIETTQMYIHANIQTKERAMAKTIPVAMKPGRFQPDDQLLAFLEGL